VREGRSVSDAEDRWQSITQGPQGRPRRCTQFTARHRASSPAPIWAPGRFCSPDASVR